MVLSRKKGEAIVIGDGSIRIVVIEIREGKVRLGFQAPPEVTVHRQEVYDAIKKQEKEHGTDQA